MSEIHKPFLPKLIAIIIVLLLSFSTVNQTTLAQTYTKKHHSQTIANTILTIYSKKGQQYTFSIPPNAVNAHLTGSYNVEGGIEEEINIALDDVNECNDISDLKTCNSFYLKDAKGQGRITNPFHQARRMFLSFTTVHGLVLRTNKSQLI